jgi:hypothetical protein
MLKAGERILQTGSACINAVGWPGLRSTKHCWRKWRLNSITPEDYATKLSPRRRYDFLTSSSYVLEDLHTCGAAQAGASTPARETALVPSDDEGAAELISVISPEQDAADGNQALSQALNLELLPTPGRT